jgi:hypothetical protein
MRIFLALFCGALLVLPARAETPAALPSAATPPATLRPAEGVLLLRNGSLIRGLITPAGNQFVVTLGETSEIRLPTTEVEAWCEDLADAYRWKSTHLPADHADAHIALADWCLKQRLFEQSEFHYQTAFKREPKNSRVAAFAERLAIARKLAEPPPKATVEIAAPRTNLDEIEQSLRDVPKTALERFAASVQPILLNRCSAGACHGVGSKSEFRLLRATGNQQLPQRFTQRNLQATLQFVDRENPLNSPLLRVPQAPHGDALAAVFDERSKRQAEEVQAWLSLFTPRASNAAAPIVAGNSAIPVKPAGQSGAETAQPSVQPASAGEALPLSKPGSAGEFRPRDPFDPEIFNRRFGPNRLATPGGTSPR